MSFKINIKKKFVLPQKFALLTIWYGCSTSAWGSDEVLAFNNVEGKVT
jgi:hypothetical protein